VTTTERVLAEVAAPLRAWPRRAVLFALAGAAALTLGVAAWTARLGWVDGGLWVGIAWGIVGLVIGLGVALWRKIAEGASLHRAAGLLERTGGWRSGALTGLLRPTIDGVSGELADAADRMSAERVANEGSQLLAPAVAGYRRHATHALALLGGAVLLLAAARPDRGRASLLWQPGEAWRAATAPIRVVGPDSAVERGTAVSLELLATGKSEATLWLRAAGESWRPYTVALDAAGRGSYTTPPIEGTLFAHLTTGGRGSDTISVMVRIPAFLGQLTVRADYPSYLGLDPEPLPLDGDTILLPAGTRLRTTGEATTELRSAVWSLGSTSHPLDVDGRTFIGDHRPDRSGDWALTVVTSQGTPIVVHLPIRSVPDSAPVIDIPVPGADTLVPLDLRVPLVIEARDDHGLLRVAVESRTITGAGVVGAPRIEEVSLGAGRPDHAVLPFTLDLNERGLLPGDSVRLSVTAWDASPGRQAGRSREYLLRLPRADEMRAAAREASREIAAALDSAAARSRRLERSTEDLAQERSRAEAAAGRGDQERALEFEAAQRAQEIAEAQREMIAEAEALEDQLEALQRAAQEAGVSDPAWQRQLDDIRQQLDRAMTPELRQALEELEGALQELDAERAERSLEELARRQEALREALERSRELFRRAAIEGDMTNLQAEARDLEQAQEQWNERLAAADSARAAAEQSQLANRADSLGSALERLGDQLRSEGREEAMDQAAQQARQAAQQMRQGAQQTRRGERQQAAQSGEQARESLDELPEQLESERDEMQEEWRQEVTAELDAALQEMARLTESQLEVAEGFRRGESASQLRQRQGAVEEGAQRVLEQLRDASGKNALVSPQLAVSLTLAQEQMRRARQSLEPATPNFREGAERAESGVDALNAVSHQLLRSRGEVGDAQSGSGMQEAMERMSQLAQQQGGVSEGAQSLLPMPGQGRGSSEMQALAQRQREVAEQLERLRAGGQAAGAGEFAEEARELARRLEAGRFDRATAERQQRLFRRMLDAGRTLQGEERDEQKERQSTGAEGDDVRLPPALRARLADGAGQIRMPSWEELQRFAPEERRLVVDYFRRLAGSR
jgi:hypothetical protein